MEFRLTVRALRRHFSIQHFLKNSCRNSNVTTSQIFIPSKPKPWNGLLRNCQSGFTTTANSNQNQIEITLDNVVYDRVCTETLDALCEYFEELTETAIYLKGTDVAYGDGVLTVNLGQKFGTYVINRQSPNKQIWLSSPTSGPKRYDYVGTGASQNGKWIYKHTGESLHELLQNEIQEIFEKEKINFYDLAYGR